MIVSQRGVVSQKEKYCHNLFSQGLGLMFSKRRNLVMVFDKEIKISLHNFFVFFPIDVLVLDSEKKIVEIKRGFKPFTFWNSLHKGKYVVELGFSSDYKEGDLLEFTHKLHF